MQPQQQMIQQTGQSHQPIIIQQVQDNTVVWVTGVVVPLTIAIIGWWLQHKWRKQNPGMTLTWKNIKKSKEK